MRGEPQGTAHTISSFPLNTKSPCSFEEENRDRQNNRILWACDLAGEEDTRLFPFGLGHVALGKTKAHGADKLEILRHIVAGLHLWQVQEGFGKAYPAGANALGVGCQHDVGCAKGCVVHIPVRGRIPVDGNDVVGIVENVVGVPSEPLLVLRKPGKLCQAGTQPGLDLGGQGLYALPALKNDKALGLHAGSCGGLRAKAQEFVDGIFGNRPVLVGTAGSAGTYALQGVHELHSFVFCCIQGR